MLCKRCGIESRTELHGKAEAKVKFDVLLDEYTKVQNEDPF
jgi:hypothetical protein